MEIKAISLLLPSNYNTRPLQSVGAVPHETAGKPVGENGRRTPQQVANLPKVMASRQYTNFNKLIMSLLLFLKQRNQLKINFKG